MSPLGCLAIYRLVTDFKWNDDPWNDPDDDDDDDEGW